MRILFCAQATLSRELGGPKVVIELAEEMTKIGWDCTVVGPEEVKKSLPDMQKGLAYEEYLREYLRKHAAEYNVVDYDHSYLPYLRKEFAASTLFVARSVLLAHHFDTIQIPHQPGWKSRVSALLYANKRRSEREKKLMQAHNTIIQADLVNVSNDDDKAELVKRHVPETKIVVIPYGMSASRRRLFSEVSSAIPRTPVVAFVGTFDYRKGAGEFPHILQSIVDRVPDVRFRLLGTAGLFQTKPEVLSHFPKHLAERITVLPRFSSEQLPELLAPCSVGIFPSHIEGFGFGVLEMLASAIPVIAYDAPGPPMMLPPEYLVPRGNAREMSGKVVSLLQDQNELQAARIWAKQQSQHFCWEEIAKSTSVIYSEWCQVETCLSK